MVWACLTGTGGDAAGSGRTIAAGQSLAKEASAVPPVPRLRTIAPRPSTNEGHSGLRPCRPAASYRRNVALGARWLACSAAGRPRRSSIRSAQPLSIGRRRESLCWYWDDHGRPALLSRRSHGQTSTGSCVMAHAPVQVSKSGATELSPHGDIVSLAQGLALQRGARHANKKMPAMRRAEGEETVKNSGLAAFGSA